MKYLYILLLVPLFAFGAGCATANQATDNTADASMSDEGGEIYPDDLAANDDFIMDDEVEDDSTTEVSDDEVEFAEDDTVYYAMEEVAMHSTKDDCWFVIDGIVYNVSGFGERHGGGEAVYEGCGKDATELFETRPMGSGTPHSDRARGFMGNFEIGELE